MIKITFSVNSKKLSFNDLRFCANLAEKYFGAEDDETQMGTSYENSKWLYKHIPESINIIKINNKRVGFTFLLPCTRKDMHDFISKEINERQLWERVKKNKRLKNFDSIYLCSAFVLPEYRRKGLALKTSKVHINHLVKKCKNKVSLFYWNWSKEGEKLALRLAKDLKIKTHSRKE